MDSGDDVDDDGEASGAQARRALGQLLGQALHLLDPKDSKGAEAGAGISAEASAGTSAEAGAASTGGGERSSNGPPPMAELVEVSATLVGGE